MRVRAQKRKVRTDTESATLLYGIWEIMPNTVANRSIVWLFFSFKLIKGSVIVLCFPARMQQTPRDQNNNERISQVCEL